jgi:hypothetical protein
LPGARRWPLHRPGGAPVVGWCGGPVAPSPPAFSPRRRGNSPKLWTASDGPSGLAAPRAPPRRQLTRPGRRTGVTQISCRRQPQPGLLAFTDPARSVLATIDLQKSRNDFRRQHQHDQRKNPLVQGPESLEGPQGTLGIFIRNPPGAIPAGRPGPTQPSLATPSCDSPAAWQPTCACPGSGLPARPPDPGPGPPRVPQHPPGTALPGQRTETRQARPRPPARLEEPAPGHPPRRGQNRQARRAQEENPQAEGLNSKLRCWPYHGRPLSALMDIGTQYAHRSGRVNPVSWGDEGCGGRSMYVANASEQLRRRN